MGITRQSHQAAESLGVVCWSLHNRIIREFTGCRSHRMKSPRWEGHCLKFTFHTYFRPILVPFTKEKNWIFDTFLWLNRENATFKNLREDGNNGNLPDFNLFMSWPIKFCRGWLVSFISSWGVGGLGQGKLKKLGALLLTRYPLVDRSVVAAWNDRSNGFVLINGILRCLVWYYVFTYLHY